MDEILIERLNRAYSVEMLGTGYGEDMSSPKATVESDTRIKLFNSGSAILEWVQGIPSMVLSCTELGIKKVVSNPLYSVMQEAKLFVHRRRLELTQATPDQPVDDEAVYLNVAGECPKGRVYGLGSLGRKKRRYADPGASTSQMTEMVPRAEFDVVAEQLRKVMAFMHQHLGMTMDGAGLSQPQPPPPPPPPHDKQQPQQIDLADLPQQGDNECQVVLSLLSAKRYKMLLVALEMIGRSRVLWVILSKVVELIGFQRCMHSCLEAVPWVGDEEEEKLRAHHSAPSVVDLSMPRLHRFASTLLCTSAAHRQLLSSFSTLRYSLAQILTVNSSTPLSRQHQPHLFVLPALCPSPPYIPDPLPYNTPVMPRH
ncbi:hypothetical protein Syun_017432 [Stephania yunnanensis]|uniref:Uncharacterized protein n=1 Tax=Stephania yunnanensis TaxID=152371 RepID=A0AAP0P533_9MAGN